MGRPDESGPCAPRGADCRTQRKEADVRETTAKHRKALADAVTRAQQVASKTNVNPNHDQLARMLKRCR